MTAHSHSPVAWHFYAVQSPEPSGFTWQWRRQLRDATVTSRLFAFYFDCVSDARKNGYEGTLPRVRGEALPSLPGVANEARQEALHFSRPRGLHLCRCRLDPWRVRPARKLMRTTSPWRR